jgi:hypothetical protein
MRKVIDEPSAIKQATAPGLHASLQGWSRTLALVGRRLEDLLPHGRRPTSTRENLGRKVFVGGLNPATTLGDLHAYFSSFGVVVDSCVITDPISKESRGFGFVEFDTKIPEGLFEMEHIIDQRRCGVREYIDNSSS